MNLEQKMYQLIEDWKKSDLTKVEFLKNADVSKDKFGYWLTKYNKINKSNIQSSETAEKEAITGRSVKSLKSREHSIRKMQS